VLLGAGGKREARRGPPCIVILCPRNQGADPLASSFSVPEFKPDNREHFADKDAVLEPGECPSKLRTARCTSNSCLSADIMPHLRSLG
jgi:hypothetical protein